MTGRLRTGFTLLELLVVLSVLSVVSTIGISAFVSITSYYNTTESRLTLENEAQKVFDSFAEDVALMVPSSYANASIHATRQMEEQQRYGRVPLEDDTVVLPISFYNPLDEQVVRASVMYYIDRSAAQPVLKRKLEGGFGKMAPEGAEQEIAEGVLSMRLDYFDGTSWQPRWDRPRHPEAIRVSVTVQDPYRPYEQMSRRTAFPVRVN